MFFVGTDGDVREASATTGRTATVAHLDVVEGAALTAGSASGELLVVDPGPGDEQEATLFRFGLDDGVLRQEPLPGLADHLASTDYAVQTVSVLTPQGA